MFVFSQGERGRLGPPGAGESMFSYLDTSARPEAQQCRDIVDAWVKEYPKNKLDRWLGDFRSTDSAQHESAFFELFLFQFFRANGWSVIVEPDVQGVRGTPDFLIENESRLAAVVEAISPTHVTDKKRGQEKLIADIKDAINSVKTSEYYLILDEMEAPTEAISKAGLVESLTKWLEMGPKEGEAFEYKDKGAVIKIKVINRPGRNVDAPEYRAIGIEMGGFSVSAPGEEVKRGLERKASKYSKLKIPYLIALNARSLCNTEDDYLAATYGTLAVRFNIDADGKSGEPETIRNHDGLFNDGGRPRKRNVSAALFFSGVAPWNWRARRSCIVHNAYADRPLENLTFGEDAFLPREGLLERVEGRNVSDLFDGVAAVKK